MTEEPIALDILGARFSIVVPDEEWAALVTQLWAPFRSREDGIALGIEITNDPDLELSIDGTPVARESDPWLLADQLRHALIHRALERRTRFVDLHAAALERGGECVLLVGPSRAGKTTLALALCDGGWNLLSDDVALIARNDAKVWPFLKPISLRSVDAWERFNHLWAPPSWSRSPRGALQVPAGVLPTAEERGHSARSVVFLNFDKGSDISLTSLTTAEAVTRCGQYVRNVEAETLSVLNEICRRADNYDVGYRLTAEAVEQIERSFGNGVGRWSESQE